MPKQPDVPRPPEEPRSRLLARLRRVEGQVRGVARMVELRRPPAEVLQQLASIQAALKGVTMTVLRSHLERCAAEAVRSPDPVVFDELLEATYKFGK